MQIGISFVIVVFAILVTAAVAVWARHALRKWRERAEQAGYASLGDYLRAAPTTDLEKREAVDLALKGLVLCVAGLMFPPLMLVGIFPLYFGARKIAYWRTGLGLFEDSDRPRA